MSKKESPQININADPALRQHNRTVIKPVSDNEIRGSKSSSATLNSQTVNTRDTSRLIRTIQGTCNNNTSSNPSPAAYNNTDKVLKLDDKTFVVETSKDVYVNNYQEIVEQRYFNNSEGNISAGYADGTNNYINVVSSANRLAFDESDFQVTEISTGIAKISSIGGGGGNGATGATGPSGPAGSSGISGFSGRSGYSGIGGSGISGFSGISGISGFSGASASGGVTCIVAGTNVTISPTSGLGVVTINSTGGGGGSPGGSNTQIQFNDGGTFGADADFTFDKLLNRMLVNGIAKVGPIQESFKNKVPQGAIFTVDVTTTEPTYTNANTAITIESGGSGYSIGDVVTIQGDLLGGTAPVNNLTCVVSSIGGLDGAITSVNTIAGTSIGAAATYSSIETQTAVSALNKAIFFMTNQPSSTFVFSVTDLNLDDNYTTNLVLLIDQGATAYLPSGISINGVPSTIKWIDGVPPLGTSNFTDVVNFTVFKFISSYVVLGQVLPFD